MADPADSPGTADLVTHTVGLDDAPHMNEVFPKKEDGCVTVVVRT